MTRDVSNGYGGTQVQIVTVLTFQNRMTGRHVLENTAYMFGFYPQIQAILPFQIFLLFIDSDFTRLFLGSKVVAV
jgi:hypothetical protein